MGIIFVIGIFICGFINEDLGKKCETKPYIKGGYLKQKQNMEMKEKMDEW